MVGEREYRIVLLGLPGAGKGTQGKLLQQTLGIPNISTGDMLREAMNGGSELGRMARSYMQKGELVPDSVIVRMVEETIGSERCAKGFILDGFPRTYEQAKALDGALEAWGKTLTKALYFELPEEEAVRRISGRIACKSCQRMYHNLFNPPPTSGRCECGAELSVREDDKEETVRKRVVVYRSQTLPLVEYYGQKGILCTIDACPTIENVQEKALRALRANA